MIRAVLLDLDGTLADTAPDLGLALNLQRGSRGLAPIPIEALRRYVSQGARGMLYVGFGLTPEQARYMELRDEFLDLYARNIDRETQLFPGIADLLDALDERDIAWGVVTNKAERFTFPLLESLGLRQRADCIVGGDTCARAKPHPDPLLEAARRLGIDPRACLYLGDDERDVQASRAAGMLAVVAMYGYLGDGNPPAQWNADAYIAHPTELLKLLAAPPLMG